jgi:tRNA (guanine-N7-)-methyltransferase
LIKPILKTHGRVFIATDWEDYAEQIIEVLGHQLDVINLAGHNKYSPRPRWRPMTKFEKRGLNKGHQVFDFALAFRN